MDNPKCDHQWKASGLWDGKTPDGRSTGGKVYTCVLCQDKAYGQEAVTEKGGKIISEDVFPSRPVKS